MSATRIRGYRAGVPDERRFLEMDDGVRIARHPAPPGRASAPWPVVFEARPYRKDDFSDATAIYRRLCDEGGLAVCRADVRGTGSSEGVAEDEYTDRESSGPRGHDRVARRAGMVERQRGDVRHLVLGVQLAPGGRAAAPALKAIIPIYATDRRYTDDVHYGGGVRRGIDFLDYPAYMVALNALPPVPSVYGDGLARGVAPTDRGERAVGARAGSSTRTRTTYWRHGSVFVRLRARSRRPRS